MEFKRRFIEQKSSHLAAFMKQTNTYPAIQPKDTRKARKTKDTLGKIECEIPNSLVKNLSPGTTSLVKKQILGGYHFLVLTKKKHIADQHLHGIMMALFVCHPSQNGLGDAHAGFRFQTSCVGEPPLNYAREPATFVLGTESYCNNVCTCFNMLTTQEEWNAVSNHGKFKVIFDFISIVD